MTTEKTTVRGVAEKLSDYDRELKIKISTFAKICDQSYKLEGGEANVIGNDWVKLKGLGDYKLRDIIKSKKQKLSKNKQSESEENDKDEGHLHMVAYFNKRQNQLVIAFRGTKPKDIGDLYNDVQLFLGMDIIDRIAPAIEYAKQKAEEVSKWSYWYKQRLFHHCHISRPSVYITGHSLGGAVAEFITKELGYPAVTFDSPGCIPHKDDFYHKNFNKILSVVSHPNAVNSLNRCLGKVLHVPVETNFTGEKNKITTAVKILDFAVNKIAQYTGLEHVYKDGKKILGSKFIKGALDKAGHARYTMKTHKLEVFLDYFAESDLVYHCQHWPKLADVLKGKPGEMKVLLLEQSNKSDLRPSKSR